MTKDIQITATTKNADDEEDLKHESSVFKDHLFKHIEMSLLKGNSIGLNIVGELVGDVEGNSSNVMLTKQTKLTDCFLSIRQKGV